MGEQETLNFPSTRKVRVTEEQFKVMISFMEQHKRFARGTLVGPEGRNISAELWAKLARKLNVPGLGPIKDPSRWTKCWSDWKSKTKAKHAAIRRHTLDSEGGPSKKLRLTPLEERVVELLRPESYKEDFYTSDEDNNDPHGNVNFVFEMDGEATSSLEIPKQDDDDNMSLAEDKSYVRTNEIPANQSEVLVENFISSEEQHIRLESRKLDLEERKLKIEEMKIQLEQRRLTMEEKNNDVRNTAITELVSVVKDLGDAFVGYLDSLQE